MSQLRLAVSKCRGGGRPSKNNGPNFPRGRGLQHARRVMPSHATSKAINAALLKRFGAEFEIDPELTGLDELEKIAGHRSHRRFLPRPKAISNNAISSSSATPRSESPLCR